MARINLLIVATSKYTQFLPQLLESADKYFLKGHQVTYNVFTDKPNEVSEMFPDKFQDVHSGETPNLKIHKIEHKPWPHATLKRFHFFRANMGRMGWADYFVYIDADARFCAPIDDEILGERVATQHCGYVDGLGLPFENNPKSTAFVPAQERRQYFGGGVWAFANEEFWEMVFQLTQAIDKDEENGIVAQWADESHINRYFVDNPPTVVLSPSYHWPENTPNVHQKWKEMNLSFECKILLLKKDHKQFQI